MGQQSNYVPAAKPKVYTKPAYTQGGLAPKVIEFFESRGIPTEVVLRNKITGEHNKIMFPYFEGGEVVNIKTRLPGKKFTLEKGARLIPYGLDDVEVAETIFVEGEMDKLAMEACGFKNCIASPSALPEKTENYNLKFLDDIDLSAVKSFILAGDMDAPGRRQMSELARRFGKGRCRLVEWPEGCKDANDVLMKHGKKKVSECLYNAKEIRTEGVFKPSESLTQLVTLYREGIAKGLSIGFDSS